MAIECKKIFIKHLAHSGIPPLGTQNAEIFGEKWQNKGVLNIQLEIFIIFFFPKVEFKL